MVDVVEICEKHASVYSDGFAHVSLSGFAEACFDGNSQDELIAALEAPEYDRSDCTTWNLSPEEWRTAIEQALAAKVIRDNDDKIPLQL